MKTSEAFRVVGRKMPELLPVKPCSPRKHGSVFGGRPLIAAAVLTLILGSCLCAELIITHDPSALNLASINQAPNGEFYFGTDSLGRDIFSMIFYGGRISLFIGFTATLLSTFTAVSYGMLAGIAAEWLDDLLMRFSEIVLSLPSLLLIILLQAVLANTGVLSLAVVIGLTSWMTVAKIVRSEVRQLSRSEFIFAARAMGGGFFYLLLRHFWPNLLPAIMFMLVTNVSSAIAAEATLSFLGIGLPVEVVSWGSMLSMADRALLTNCWWVIVIPGLFLVATLVCLADIGNYLRKSANMRDSYL